MNAFEFHATLDGNKIDIPVYLLSQLGDTKQCRVIILVKRQDETDATDDFYSSARLGLASAYSNNEPDYTLSCVQEPNPEYGTR